jgi:hypothetical protein
LQGAIAGGLRVYLSSINARRRLISGKGIVGLLEFMGDMFMKEMLGVN